MTTNPTALAENPPASPTSPAGRVPGRHPVRNGLLIGGGTLLLFAGGLTVVVNSNDHRDTTSYAASGIREVTIDGDAGNVTFQQASGSEVQVTTSRHWSLAAPKAEHHVDNGVLTITGDCSWFGPGCHVSHAVDLPAGVAVRVTQGAGTVEATNVDVASFDAHLGAGTVTASFTSAPDHLSATTGAGDVRLSVPQGSYRVAADTTVGDVSVGVTQENDAQHEISADTTAGNIAIQGR